MEISFKGKRILVTGAGQGIGRGIAVELWRAGANIVALSRTRSHLEALQSEYPSIDIVDVDIGNWEKTRKVVESLGHFDALVNNAAIAVCEPFLDCSPTDFDKTFDVNVKAVLNISQIVARKMVENKTHGAIVNISSQASKVLITRIPRIILTINLCFTILICALLIVAVHKRRSWLMLPWVVLGFVLAIGLLITVLHTSISYYLGKDPNRILIGTVILVVGILYLCLYIYLYAVVYSYFVDVREEEVRGRYRKPPYRR